MPNNGNGGAPLYNMAAEEVECDKVAWIRGEKNKVIVLADATANV